MSSYKGRRFFKADNGKQGMGGNMAGKSGESLVLIVPPGTQVFDDDTNELLFDLIETGEKVLFLEVATNIDTQQINPSSLLAYMGIRGVGRSNTQQNRTFNATSILAYYEICK